MKSVKITVVFFNFKCTIKDCTDRRTELSQRYKLSAVSKSSGNPRRFEMFLQKIKHVITLQEQKAYMWSETFYTITLDSIQDFTIWMPPVKPAVMTT